jgi:hypothetical protein
MIPVLAPTPPFIPDTKLVGILGQLGLLTSLQWVVDFGDSDSISATDQQTLGTIPSGGIVFTRGPNSSVDAQRDGTFVGTLGKQSSGEYLSVNGTTVLPLGRVASPRATWSDNAHKNSALFTFAGWFYRDAAASGAWFFYTGGFSAGSPGINIGATLDGDPDPNCPYLEVGNSSGGFAASLVADTLTVPKGSAMFVALSADEASGSFVFQINGSQQTVSATYSSPSSSTAALTEANVSAGNNENTNTGRVYNAAWWSRALSASELLGLYNADKSKFGL